MEVESFRIQFRKALVAVIYDSYQYVPEGCSLRKILPRTLAYLSEDKTGRDADHGYSQVEEWLSQSGVAGDVSANNQAGQDQETWQRILLDILDARELSYSELNRKRKQLTFSAFRDSSLISKSVALETLVAPNVRCQHRLFQRTEIIAELLNSRRSALALSVTDQISSNFNFDSDCQ
ncbi:unnamed protein product, partial [Durusdinium trenchii]